MKQPKVWPAVLGKVDAPDASPVSLDVDGLIRSRMLLQANSGGGKSWAIRRLLEVTFGRVQHIVVDVDDEFHTLREKHDYVIASPRGGDCPATVRSAPLLARRLLELGVSAILGIYELLPHERIEFVKAFLKSLMNAPRDLWHPVLVVIDEAHLFCPQSSKAESAEAVISLMTQGRKRGFCGVLATQRLAKLHKDAAAEANIKMVGRCNIDVDRKRAIEELGLVKDADLSKLDPGHFYIYGPAVQVNGERHDRVIRMVTGPVHTTHPEAGQRSPQPPPPREKVRAALSQLADLPKEAEEQERSVAALEAANKELRRKLAAAERAQPAPPRPAIDATVLERERNAAYREGYGVGAREAHEHAVKEVEDYLVVLRGRVQHTLDILKPPQLAGLKPPKGMKAPPAPPLKPTTPAMANEALARAFGGSPENARGLGIKPERVNRFDSVSGPVQRVLDALAWFEAIDVRDPERPPLAAIARYSHESSGFENTLGAMRTAGLITYPRPGAVSLTAEGRAIAVTPEMRPTAWELHQAVFQVIDGPCEKLLRVILACYPDRVSRTDLAAATGYSEKSSGFENALGRLRSLSLIEYPERGYARARDILFPDGPQGLRS